MEKINYQNQQGDKFTLEVSDVKNLDEILDNMGYKNLEFYNIDFFFENPIRVEIEGENGEVIAVLTHEAELLNENV